MIGNSLLLVSLRVGLRLSDVRSWHLVQQLSRLNKVSQASHWLRYFLINNHLVIDRLLQELSYILLLMHVSKNVFFRFLLG